MKVAFSTLGCPSWPWELVLTRAEELGYDGLELRLVEDRQLPDSPAFAGAEAGRRLAEMRARGLEPCCVASTARFDDPATVEDNLTAARRHIDAAARLGVSAVRVFGDVLADPDDPQDTVERIAGCIAELARYAEGTGVWVLQETHRDFADSRLLTAVMEAADHPGVGVVWDIAHPYRLAGEPVEETYARLRPYVRHVQVRDTRVVGGRVVACLLGEGDVPTERALRLLHDAGYAGWVSVEWERPRPDLLAVETILPQYQRELRALLRAIGAGQLP